VKKKAEAPKGRREKMENRGRKENAGMDTNLHLIDDFVRRPEGEKDGGNGEV